MDTSEFWKAHGQVEVDKVYSTEINAILRKKKAPNTAPGIDGVKTSALKKLSESELAILAYCFSKCLEEGRFPKEWKKAYLVLIPEEWPLDPIAPKVRPICLLNETGKLMECRGEADAVDGRQPLFPAVRIPVWIQEG